jgi:hypothetical protein
LAVCLLLGGISVKAQCKAWSNGHNNVHKDKYLAAFRFNCHIFNGNLYCYWTNPTEACAAAVQERAWEYAGSEPVKFTNKPPTKINDDNYMCNYTRSDISSVISGEFGVVKENVIEQPFESFGNIALKGPYRSCPELGNVVSGAVFVERQITKIKELNRARHGFLKSDLCDVTIGGYKETCEPLNDLQIASDKRVKIHQIIPIKDRQTCNCGTNSYQNALVVSEKMFKILANLPTPPSTLLTAIDKIKPYPCN